MRFFHETACGAPLGRFKESSQESCQIVGIWWAVVEARKYFSRRSRGSADRLAIRELVEAYAHCADRRDAKG